MDLASMAVGAVAFAVGALVVYFLYLAASKGLPAAWAWLKAKWNAGATELATLRADFNQLEQGAVASINSRLTSLESEFKAIKPQTAAAALAAAAAAPAPAASATA